MRRIRRYRNYIAYAVMGVGGIFTGILLIPIGILTMIIYSILDGHKSYYLLE